MPVDRVMVVDGHSTLANSIRILLHTHRPDIHIQAFSSADFALDRITSGFSGVVLAAIGMTPITGMTLLRDARRARPDLPVVAMMAPYRYGLAIEALNAGAYAIISNPLKREECIRIVQGALGMNRLARIVDANRIRLQRCVRRLRRFEALPRPASGASTTAAARTRNPTADTVASAVALLIRAETRLKQSHGDLSAAQGQARLQGWLRAGERVEDLVPVSCYVR